MHKNLKSFLIYVGVSCLIGLCYVFVSMFGFMIGNGLFGRPDFFVFLAHSLSTATWGGAHGIVGVRMEKVMAW
ncbi:MAG: hypothetical protein AB7W16_24145 [Candidatus Obscuribacterales bacterium]